MLALGCLLLGGLQPVSAKIIIPSEEADKSVTTDKLRRSLEFLSDPVCEGRATGTRGGTEAAFWIESRFRQLGMQSFGGTFAKHFRTPGGAVGRNLIGFLPGSNARNLDSYVLVMAHYDGLGILDGTLYPGADSNASGVVSLLQIADMMGIMRRFRKSYNRNVIFVALDAKGLNMAGAASLWEWIDAGRLTHPDTGRPVTREKIALVVNIDQVGSVLSPIRPDRPDYLLMLGGESVSSLCNTQLRSCNGAYGTALDLGFDYYGSKDFTRLFYRRISDHRFFVENGMPAVLFTSGITMNNNKVTDTVDGIDLGVLRKRIILMFHWLERFL